MIQSMPADNGVQTNGPEFTDGFPPRWAAVIVAFATLLAYSNSFRGQFVMDDVFEIAQNPALLRLWPPLEAMFVGNRLPARPLPYLSFAIDRALWGSSVFGFHLTNLAIHVIAALALFDFTRRTLCSPRLAATCGRHATGLALAVATLWAVHPLQTQAVTYVYQRIESMAGMFALLSLASFARAAFGGWSRGWLAATAAAAVAAAFSKESAVVLPLLMLAYDWTFVARDGREVAGRWRWYALLSATWLIVAGQVWLQRGAYAEFREPEHGPVAYALTQPGVILHYIRLAVWPSGQCLDYEWPIADRAGEIVPPLALILAAAAATIAGLWHRRPWAWPAAAFFLCLAPTSSVLPVSAVAAEHRMYLPLAALVAAAVVGAHALLALIFRTTESVARQGWPIVACAAAAALAVALGVATQRRNEAYHDIEGMWRQILDQAPENFRAEVWQAIFCDERADTEAAVRHAERAVELHPHCDIFGQLAASRAARGDFAAAESMYDRGLAALKRALPQEEKSQLIARYNLAAMHTEQRRFHEAEAACGELEERLAAALGSAHPATIGCRTILAAAANRRGDYDSAERLAVRNLAAAKSALGAWHPTVSRAAEPLAVALLKSGREAESARLLGQLLGEANSASWWRTVDGTALEQSLAGVLEESGRPEEALQVRRHIHAMLTARHGPNVTETRRAAVRLALCEGAIATRAGEKVVAERCAHDALSAAIDGLGFADPLTQSAVVEYAAALFQGGRQDDAEQALREFLSRASAAAPTQSEKPDLVTVAQALAGLLERTERIDQAIPIRKQILRETLQRYGPDAEPTQRAAQAIKAAIDARGRDGEKPAPKEPSP